MIGEGHLPGRHPRAAADEGRVRGGVVGCPEGPLSDEAVDRSGAGDGGHDRGLPGLVVVERRQDPRDRPRQHRLARPGRPDQHEPVASGQGDLEGPACLEEAAHVRQVGRLAARPRAAGRGRGGALGGHELRPVRRGAAGHPSPAKDVGGLRQRSGPDDLDPLDEARLVDRVRGHDDPPRAAPGEGRDHREETRDRTDLAPQAELAEERPAAARGHLLRADEDGEGDPEVEGGAGLGDVGGSQVDGDPTGRVDEPAVSQGAPDPLPGLSERGVGEAHDREARQPGGHVDLDPHGPTLEAVEGGGEDACEHGPHGSGERLPAGQRSLIGDAPGRSQAAVPASRPSVSAPRRSPQPAPRWPPCRSRGPRRGTSARAANPTS